MPSVVRVDQRLALFFDASATSLDNNMQRDIGLAWLQLPLVPPSQERSGTIASSRNLDDGKGST